MDVIRKKEDNTRRYRLAAAIGMFDGVHLGHQTLISHLCEEAYVDGLLPAVVTFSRHPQQVLRPDGGLRMLMTLEDRLKYLDEMGVEVAIVMDFTAELAQMTSREFMQYLRDEFGVETIVMGFNHRFGHNRGEYFEDYVSHGAELGVKVVRAKEYKGEHSPVSSSLIRKMIEEGRVNLAKDCLSRPFSLAGEVVHGFKNGRKLGFPTANIDVTSELIMPHKGVYAVRVLLENGEIHGGMANIGVRPTVIKGGNQTFEVNIFDFDEEIYGQTLKVWFLKFMRSEAKMGSLEELKSRLTIDKEECTAALMKF